MDFRYLIFLLFLLMVVNLEGFTNIYHQNLNLEKDYPDKEQFFPVHNHSKIKLRNREELTILGNNNYKIINNTIKEPQSGPYSAFLDVNKFRNYDQFFHAPITDKTYRFDVGYERQYNYDIIQNEDLNKKELLTKEKENDKLIHNPDYLYGHPKNTSKILYNEPIQKMFLKFKNETNRYENVSHKGPGFHDLE